MLVKCFELDDRFRDAARRAEEMVSPLRARRDHLRAQVLDRKEYPVEVWRALADAGYFGALVPAEHGGNGRGLLDLALGLEAIGSLAYADVLPVLTSMATACIADAGSDELKASFLPRLASGQIRCCVAATEGESGSNMFRIQTSATAVEDGFVINGSKLYTSGFDVADHMLLVARTRSREQCEREGLPRTAGLAVFIVDTSTPGITRRALGTRGEPGLTQFELLFHDVRVPAAGLVGLPDLGAMALFRAINVERILGSAMALGIARHALDVAVAHARVRKVFKDAPIGQYQAIQHPLAEVRIRLEGARLMVYRAASLFGDSDDPVEVGFQANCAKFLCSELAIRAVDAAIETLGGKGFDEHHHLVHLWEMVRLFKTAPTSNNMILNFVAEHQLELPRSY